MPSEPPRNFTVEPPSATELLKKRHMDLVLLIKKQNEELDAIERQIEWLKRFPELEAILQSLKK